MASVDKSLADKIIALNGYYGDDERVMQVIKYKNNWGGDSYALLYKRDVEVNRYQASDYVINPEIIWRAE